MQIDLPDTIPMTTLKRVLEACGVQLDPRAYKDGVHRTTPIGPGVCTIPECGIPGTVLLRRQLYCAHHARETMQRDAGA